jgi:hypothetical protein
MKKKKRVLQFHPSSFILFLGVSVFNFFLFLQVKNSYIYYAIGIERKNDILMVGNTPYFLIMLKIAFIYLDLIRGVKYTSLSVIFTLI